MNWDLMNRIDYSNPRIVKNVLRNYDELMRLALKGDAVAMTICVDIKRAVRAKGVLTFKQRRYLALWWQGLTTIEIATNYHKAPRAIGITINRAFGNISSFLSKKYPFYPSKLGISEGGLYAIPKRHR